MHDFDIKAVGFDYDGTIVPSYRHRCRYIQALAELHNLPYTKETEALVIEHWGVPGPELLSLCFEISLEHGKRMYADWPRIELEIPMPLIRGARKTLQMLNNAGVHCGLITSRNRSSLDESLRTKRILDSFCHTASRCETIGHKPEPSVFTCWLAKLKPFGIAAHQVAYVGDGKVDIEAAQGAGMVAIAVETGPNHQFKGLARAPHKRFPTIAHVGPWILKQPYRSVA